MTNELAIVVLAAGQGTRMRSRMPKVLHPLGGRPLVAHALDTAASLNPVRIEVVVRPARDRVVEALLDLPPDVRLVAQDRSEEPRVGKECVRTCRSRWSRSP